MVVPIAIGMVDLSDWSHPGGHERLKISVRQLTDVRVQTEPPKNIEKTAGMVELVDTRDLKSRDLRVVRVQVPLLAQKPRICGAFVL